MVTCPKRNEWKHAKVMQSGKKNCLVIHLDGDLSQT